MFMVAPSGSTKPATVGGTPISCSAVAMLVGSVALLELVEKAVMTEARAFFQKTSGLMPPRKRTSREMETAACRKRPPALASQCL